MSTGDGHREKHRQIGHTPTYAHLITHQEPQRAKRESASETSAGAERVTSCAIHATGWDFYITILSYKPSRTQNFPLFNFPYELLPAFLLLLTLIRPIPL